MKNFIIDFEHVDIQKIASFGCYGIICLQRQPLAHLQWSFTFFLKTKLFKRPTVKCHLEYESVKGSKLLFSFSDSVSVFHNFPYTSPLYVCVNIELDIYRCAEYNVSGVKLHMHIRTVSTLHVLPQSNCPPIFTSTKVATLEWLHAIQLNLLHSQLHGTPLANVFTRWTLSCDVTVTWRDACDPAGVQVDQEG